MSDFLQRYSQDPLDGKYRLIEQLGAGGMGEVFKAEHVLLGVTRVIKIVRAQISGSSDARERFLREARLATRVQHVNVAALYDFAEMPGGLHYMVWEYIDGENVAQLLKRRGAMPPHEAVGLAVQALRGLEAIHRAGIVHRDISPENLMVTRDHTLKIIDLGVAKGGAETADESMTSAGVFIGKVRYASPEHFGIMGEGERIDGRADLYSLGLTLYEMLAGRRPLESTSPHDYIIRHSREGGAPLPDLTLIAEPLRPIIARALENDRNRRFASAAELASALERVRFTDEAATQITPVPAMAAAATQITVIPPATTATGGRRLLLFTAIALLAGIAILVVLLRLQRMPSEREAAPISASSPPAAPTQSTIAVTAPPSAIATTTTATAAPAPAPAAVTASKPETRSAPAEPAREEPTETAAQTEPRAPAQQDESEMPRLGGLTYFDGGGDSSRNSEAIEAARRALTGVTAVRLQTNGDPELQAELADLLRRNGLTISDVAPVVIHFRGGMQHRRFGRKRRAASAAITRNGRLVFRYELPAEEYRVGDNPAEAFARVAADLFR
jgi:tRNA A-37 threonylcarbamoyl transferase component Bud32